MAERVTVGELARVLGESCHVLLARCLQTLGQDRCVAILVDALTIESNGGTLVQDGSRRRSPGGTFLHLVRERATAEERRQIFKRRAPRHSQQKAPTASPGSPAPAPFSLPGSSPQ